MRSHKCQQFHEIRASTFLLIQWGSPFHNNEIHIHYCVTGLLDVSHLKQRHFGVTCIFFNSSTSVVDVVVPQCRGTSETKWRATENSEVMSSFVSSNHLKGTYGKLWRRSCFCCVKKIIEGSNMQNKELRQTIPAICLCVVFFGLSYTWGKGDLGLMQWKYQD